MSGEEEEGARCPVAAGKAKGYEEGWGGEDLEGLLRRLCLGLRLRLRGGLLRNGEGGGHRESSPPMPSIQSEVRDALQMVGLREEVQQMHISEAIAGFY